MLASFTFLTTGPPIELTIPDAFDPIPDLSAPLSLGDRGGRSFDFVAASRDVGVREPHAQVGQLTSPDGVNVEVLERKGEPAQWFLRWVLPTGGLYTHIREEDGLETADVVVESLRLDTRGELPVLLPEKSLKRVVSSRAGYQETAIFYGVEGGFLELRRPGQVTVGRLVQSPSVPPVFRTGAPGGITVSGGYGDNPRLGQKAVQTAAKTLATA